MPNANDSTVAVPEDSKFALKPTCEGLSRPHGSAIPKADRSVLHAAFSHWKIVGRSFPREWQNADASCQVTPVTGWFSFRVGNVPPIQFRGAGRPVLSVSICGAPGRTCKS